MSKFKVGDRVRVTATRFTKNQTGKVGTVESLDNDYLPIKVLFDDGGMNTYDYCDLEPANKFKAGDQVRYKDGSGGVKIVARPKTYYGKNPADVYSGSPAVDYVSGGWDREESLELVPVDQPKFKVGDRVISIHCKDAGVGIVLEPKANNNYLVDFADSWYGKCIKHESGISIAPTAVATQQPHIIARVVGGIPRPSSFPFVHSDQDSANREAARLAAANPGVEFAVYARVSGKIADVTVREVA